MIALTERAGRVCSIRLSEVQGSYRDAVTTYAVFHIPVFYSEDGGGWFLLIHQSTRLHIPDDRNLVPFASPSLVPYSELTTQAWRQAAVVAVFQAQVLVHPHRAQPLHQATISCFLN